MFIAFGGIQELSFAKRHQLCEFEPAIPIVSNLFRKKMRSKKWRRAALCSFPESTPVCRTSEEECAGYFVSSFGSILHYSETHKSKSVSNTFITL